MIGRRPAELTDVRVALRTFFVYGVIDVTLVSRLGELLLLGLMCMLESYVLVCGYLELMGNLGKLLERVFVLMGELCVFLQEPFACCC